MLLFAISESDMEKYNKRNATEYTRYYQQIITHFRTAGFTIETGKYISNTGTLKIKKYDQFTH